MIRVFVLTVSDSCAQGRREDVSGRTVEQMLGPERFEVWDRAIVPDDRDAIEAAIVRAADEGEVDLVLTTGGTGLGPRDATPEATASVCERMVPGLGELMRSEGFRRTPNAVLSRGIAGILKNTLVVNLPGSPKAVRECLEVLAGVLPHAIEMMHGGGH